MDIKGPVVGLHIGFVCTIIKVKGDIKEVYDFAICFNSNFQSIGLKNPTQFFFYDLSLSRRFAAGRQAVVPEMSRPRCWV